MHHLASFVKGQLQPCLIRDHYRVVLHILAFAIHITSNNAKIYQTEGLKQLRNVTN